MMPPTPKRISYVELMGRLTVGMSIIHVGYIGPNVMFSDLSHHENMAAKCKLS